ncbi:interleukin-15 receptor subunit alpha isoform X3 [Etheostoma spectabile]|uniref:interleukin-15 receptor subunit alpha isoform X3 n=1 Tax=Etheostoma spectabile TaxID=54343 RepID=UPI0013AEF045|nr:interleukin-15 receptor subunit alpha isoform X3 [Etheostoma spectabile]
MDLGSSLFFVICLLGAALRSSGDNISCPCPKIPLLDLTEPPLDSCRQIDNTYRYTCKVGYIRKVGTSNLIKCRQEGGSPKWSTPTLQCKEEKCFGAYCKADPNRPPPTQPPTSTVTNIPTGTTIVTSVTSTCQPMIQSTSTAAPGLQAQTDHSQAPIIETETTETKGTTGTQRTTSTSTTTEPSSNSTIPAGTALPGIGSTTTAVIGCASLAFVLALIGISLYCYKRKSRNSSPPEPTEEQLYLNAAPCSIRVCST